MSEIYFNDKPEPIFANTTLEKVLINKGYTGQGFAVAVNRNFIPRSKYSATPINHGDWIDIILPMQGG